MTPQTFNTCPSPWTSLTLSTSKYGPCCYYRFTEKKYLSMHLTPGSFAHKFQMDEGELPKDTART